jgi:two-component system, chemotaxis family, sensor kinase CheA
MDPFEQLRLTFLEECDELLGALERHLTALADGQGTSDDVNAAFRAVHSIKGGAGAFGFSHVVETAHLFEAAMDLIRSGRTSIEAAPYPVFLRAVDSIASLLNAARDGTPKDAPADLVAQLRAASKGEAVQATQTASAPASAEPEIVAVSPAPPAPQAPHKRSLTIKITPAPDLYRRAVEPQALIRILEGFGSVVAAIDIDALPSVADFDPERAELVLDIALNTEAPLERIVETLEMQLAPDEFKVTDAAQNITEDWGAADTEALSMSWDEAPTVSAEPEPQAAHLSEPVAPPVQIPAPIAAPERTPPPAKARQQSSVRVDLDRIDRLMNLVGEIVITQSMLDQRLQALPVAETMHLTDSLQVLARQTRELQESVMAVRAQPVSNVFQRMPRLVRELAETLGKEARLVLIGEDTEVDKTIIEELADPLTHMIRNAMDHGVEKGDARAAQGKARQGTITLSAEQRGGRIVISVSDDGRGLNRERLLEKAQSRGLLRPDQRLSPDEIDALIFHPGLSTAEAVTDVSGRGVGMDVVKQNVEALGGRIMVTSEPGHGSRFTLLLPLTLAVMDGMVVRVASERFVLPVASVIETLQLAEAKIETLPGGREVLHLRNELPPLIRLAATLGLTQTSEDQIIVMTETDRGERIGLAVEEIVSQQQVVVKSLEASYGRVPGASAATILGDGLVALIVDVDAIPELAAHRHFTPLLQAA